MSRHEYFSEARIALMRELKNHPELLTQLEDAAAAGTTDWSDQLGIIAAYFNVVMDGMYSHLDLEVLTDKLWHKLVAKRRNIITPPVGNIVH